jgi:hypothetical protein
MLGRPVLLLSLRIVYSILQCFPKLIHPLERGLRLMPLLEKAVPDLLVFLARRFLFFAVCACIVQCSLSLLQRTSAPWGPIRATMKECTSLFAPTCILITR